MTGTLKTLGVLCLCAAVVGLAAGGGCSSDEDTTGAAGSGGSTGNAGSGGSVLGGSGGGSPLGGGCGTLTNDAPGVAETAGSGTIPTMTGGTIVDGTYFITERLDYSGGTCGCTNKTVAIISGGGTMLQAVSRTDTAADQNLRWHDHHVGQHLDVELHLPGDDDAVAHVHGDGDEVRDG